MNSLPLPDPSELIPEHQDLVVDIEAEWELRNSTLRRDPRYVQQSLTSVLNDPRAAARTLTWPEGSSIRPPPRHMPLIALRDLQPYIDTISQYYHLFQQDRAAETLDEGETAPLAEKMRNSPLSVIPHVYYREDFSLNNPEVFAIACEPALSSPVMAQEKLSHYLDLVEVEIVNQVGGRSRSFFAALSGLQQLHAEVALACQSIANIRSGLRAMEADTKQSLNITRQQRKRKHLCAVIKKLKLMDVVRQTQPTVQLLLSNNDFIGALSLINRTQMILRSELKGIQSFKHLGLQLNEMVLLIERIMSEEFSRISSARMVPLTFEPYCTMLCITAQPDRVSANIDVQPEWRQVLSDTLQPLIAGLLHLRRIHAVITSYRDVLHTQYKTLIQQVVDRCLPALPAPFDHVNGAAAEKSTGTPSSTGSDTAASAGTRQQQQSLRSTSSSFLLGSGGATTSGGLLGSGSSASLSAGTSPSAAASKNHRLVARIKALEHEEFVFMLAHVYSVLQAALQQTSAVHEIVQASLSNRGSALHLAVEESISPLASQLDGYTSTATTSSSSSSSNNERSRQAELSSQRSHDSLCQYAEQVVFDSADVVRSTVELVHMKLCRIFKLREEVNCRLSLDNFATLIRAANEFIEQTEHLLPNTKSILSFRGVLQSQAKEFLRAFHQKRMSTIAVILESEKWKQAEVAAEFQSITNAIVSHQPPLKESSSSSASSASTSSSDGAAAESSSGNNTMLLLVGQQECRTVNSALLFLKMLLEYLECVRELPSLHPQILQSIVELLKVFNSRTCQLVLGAGAMHVARLRSITAKHLALAAQTVSLMIEVIPHLKECLAPYFAPEKRVLLSDFDKVLQDYIEHRKQIFDKFTAIMRERLEAHCGALAEQVPWAQEPRSASVYVQNILKETSTLYNVLRQTLSGHELQCVFDEIFAMFNAQLVEYYSLLRLSNMGKKRLWIDIMYLIDGLRGLDELESSVQQLNVLKNFYRSHFGEPPVLASAS